MSILIKGMEMPSVGTGKVIMIDSDGDVWAAGKDDYTIISGAKAAPVPKHGRLIDADALLDDLLFPSKQFEQGMRELIGDAPTVIPAEETIKEATND